jgi:hypothetical protein
MLRGCVVGATVAWCAGGRAKMETRTASEQVENLGGC